MKEVHIVTSVAINPQMPTILYAGTTGVIYRSDNATATWKRINRGLIPEQKLMASMALGVNAIEVNQVMPDIVYAGTTKGLFRSANRGEQWERIGQSISDPFISSVVIHPTDPSLVYVGGPECVWKSTDGGKKWQAINQGLVTLNIRALALAPNDSQMLYSGTNGSGLYRLGNAGETWVPVSIKTALSASGSGHGQS